MIKNTINTIEGAPLKKTPLTIITGYLGAGKTTLLRHIIANSDKKIAILMNEFGDISIDGRIIEGKNVRIAELSGGCVCCSMTGEFELAVKEVIEKANPEWIVLETTGVAEPNAIIMDIEQSLPEIRLDATVTVVDADAVIRFPSLGHTGIEQIEMGNVILLNKCDLLNEKQVKDVEEKISMINKMAFIMKTEKCEVPLEAIFGVGEEMVKENQASRKIKNYEIHNPDVQHFVFFSDRMKKDDFMDFTRNIPRSIYRAKGFVVFENESWLFNYVFGRVSLEPFAAKKTELVFIGKDILNDKEKIIGRLNEISQILQ